MADSLELWLVRHGETTRGRDGRIAGWSNVRLTARGVAEADALRGLLAPVRFDGVWCSDLARARATARHAWGEARPERRLRELDFGTLEGAHWDEVPEPAREALLRWDRFAAPGGESVDELRARVAAFLEGLCPGRHLLFTHGGVIRVLSREAGVDRFVPTGSVVALDWGARRILFLHTQEGAEAPFSRAPQPGVPTQAGRGARARTGARRARRRA